MNIRQRLPRFSNVGIYPRNRPVSSDQRDAVPHILDGLGHFYHAQDQVANRNVVGDARQENAVHPCRAARCGQDWPRLPAQEKGN